MKTDAKVQNLLYCEGNVDGTIGGSYYSLFFLVEGLDKKKYNPIVVFHKEHDLLPMFKSAGIETHIFELPKSINLVARLNCTSILFKPLIMLQKFLNVMRFLVFRGIKYAIFLKRKNVKLIHLNNSILRNHSWMLASVLSGIKCITHERGINEKYSRLSRFFARRLSAIICISNAVKQKMIDKSFDPKNLVLIYNGLDPEKIQIKHNAAEMRTQYQIEQDSPIIGIVGNIREWKGQEVVIKATYEISKKYKNVKCLVVGDTTPEHQRYYDGLLKSIDELGISNNVIFTGYTSNVADYLNIMDIVVHASILPEPFGRVLIEAMALGKPLIGSASGAVPEIIENGVTGLIFKPGDSMELSHAVVKLLKDRKKASEMGRNGARRLLDEFHVSRNIERTEQLYSKLLE